MAKIKGFELKAIKKTMGKEGVGLIANIYLNNKKIGSYEDWGDGAMGNAHYNSKEDEETMMHLIYAYANIRPDKFMVNLYEERPERYQEEVERVHKYFPYITEDEININSLSANHIDFIVDDFMMLLDLEKSFKAAVKKGYSYIGVKEEKGYVSAIYKIPEKCSKEKVDALGCEKFYRSLNDFIIA